MKPLIFKKAAKSKIKQNKTLGWRILMVAVVFISVLAAGQTRVSFAQSSRNEWQFTITPYLWLPNIEGTLNYDIPSGGNSSPEVEVGPNDYLENLDFAIMINAEVRKERWSVFTDVIYLDFSNEKSNVKSINFINTGKNLVSSSLDAGTQTNFEAVSWTLAGSYSMLEGDLGRLELLAGFRYFGLEASSGWNLTAAINGPGGSQVFPRSGSISQREDIWDGVIGFRGRLNLGTGQFYIPYYFDIGTGSSQVTWNGVIGLGYGFKWGDIMFDYRHLYYDMDNGDLLQDMSFSGPALGVIFRF